MILEEGMLREKKTLWKDRLEGECEKVRDCEIAGENPRSGQGQRIQSRGCGRT